MNPRLSMPNVATTTGVIQVPAIAYKSGGRIWYALTIPFKTLGKFIRTTSSRKKNQIIDKNIKNRFLDPKHKNDIKNYIHEEKEFTIPPITLVSIEKLDFRPYNINGQQEETESIEELLARQSSVIGIIFLPLEYEFECLDGNHRTVAIMELAEDAPEFVDGSSMLLNIVFESSSRKIRQDFVDINKNAKATTASINTIFNTREPIPRIVADLRDNIKYLNDMTDLLAASVSKNSKDIYTINNIKNAVIEVAGYNSQSTGENKLNSTLLVNESLESKTLRDSILFFNKLSTNPFIKECINNHDRVPEIRNDSVLTSGTGIVIAARLAGYIFKNFYAHTEVEKQLDKVVKYDWSRKNPVFEDNIITGPDQKIVNSRNAIIQAYESVALSLGYQL